MAVYQLPEANALDVAQRVKEQMAVMARALPGRPGLGGAVRYDFIRRGLDCGSGRDPVYRTAARSPGDLPVSAGLARNTYPQHRHPGIADRHFRRDAADGYVDQHHQSVRPDPGHWYRRGRCHRGHRERTAAHERRYGGKGGYPYGNARGHRTRGCDHAGAACRFRAGRLHAGHYRPVVQPVCDHHFLCRGNLVHQRADPEPRPVCDPAQARQPGRSRRFSFFGGSTVRWTRHGAAT